EAARSHLLVVERAVGADEVAAALEEVLAARAGTGGLVVDGDVGVGGLERGDPGLLGGGLGGGARGVDGAGERRLGRLVGGAACAGFVRGTAGESESGDGADGADTCDSGDLHCGSFDRGWV